MSEVIDPPVASINLNRLTAEITGPLVTITQAMFDAQADTVAKYATYRDSELRTTKAESDLVAANLIVVNTALTAYHVSDALKKTAEAAYSTEIQLVLSMIQSSPTVPALPIPLPG